MVSSASLVQWLACSHKGKTAAVCICVVCSCMHVYMEHLNRQIYEVQLSYMPVTHINTNLHTPMHAHAAQRSHTYTCMLHTRPTHDKQSICNSTVPSSSYTDLAGPSLRYEFSSVSEAQSTQLVPMRRLGRALLPQAKVHLTEIGDVQQVFAKVRLCGPNKSREDKA